MPTLTVPIRKIGILTCKGCGHEVEVELDCSMGWGACSCGATNQWSQEGADLADVFALFGYILSLDYDGQLMVECQRELSADVYEWLFHHQGQIRSSLERKGRASRGVYVGGAMNGKRHRFGYRLQGERVYVHVGRAHWETYESHGHNDPRLFFIGRATSKAKAKTPSPGCRGGGRGG